MKHTLSGIITQPESLSSASWPQQAKNIEGKSSRGSKQSNAYYSTRYQPLTDPPETYIAKPIHLEKHLPASSKQSRYKQGPLWRPSTFPLGDKLSSDLKGHSTELTWRSLNRLSGQQLLHSLTCLQWNV